MFTIIREYWYRFSFRKLFQNGHTCMYFAVADALNSIQGDKSCGNCSLHAAVPESCSTSLL